MSANKLRRGVVLGLLAVTVGGVSLSVAQSAPQQSASKSASAAAPESVAIPADRTESFSLLETGWE